MPLLDLKTNLKSLSFNSTAPYIQKDINNPGTPSSNPAQARIEDSLRISKFLLDAGGTFAAKQAMLEASTADTLSDIFSINTIAGPAARLTNILAQIPVNGTGTHFLPRSRSLYYTGVTDASSRALAGTAIGNTSQQQFPEVVSRVSRTSSTLTGTPTQRVNVGLRSFIDQQNSLTAELDAIGTIEGFAPLGSERGLSQTITDTSNQVKENGTYLINDFNGSKSLDSRYSFAGAKRSDAINLLDIGSPDDKLKKDLLPVIFSIHGNEVNTALGFRGFVKGIQDTYTADWQGVNYVGRMEKFFTYTGFSRTFGFTLTIPIFSEAEQPAVYNKANSLVSYTAPQYTGNLPKGIITQLTLGDFIRTAGIITSIGMTVDDDVPWSIGGAADLPYFSQADGAETRLLPQVITLAIQFTPIHSKAPQYYGRRPVASISTTGVENGQINA